jgi:hypothetical protein
MRTSASETASNVGGARSPFGVAVAATGIPVVLAFEVATDHVRLPVQSLTTKERRFATFGSVRLMAAAFPNKGPEVFDASSGFLPSSVHATYRTPNKAPEPTTMAVTSRAPSSTRRASHGRGSS